MLKEMLKDNISFVKEVESWEEAVKVASKPLLEQGYITENYINAMINNVIQNGSYIVIVPKFALPHARPEEGTIKTGLSFLKLEQAVMFPENKEVELLIVLAANDPDTHVELLSELTDVFIDEEKLNALFSCKSKKEVMECL